MLSIKKYREKAQQLSRGVAQSGLAHLNGVQGVAGSNPVAPTTIDYPGDLTRVNPLFLFSLLIVKHCNCSCND